MLRLNGAARVPTVGPGGACRYSVAAVAIFGTELQEFSTFSDSAVSAPSPAAPSPPAPS